MVQTAKYPEYKYHAMNNNEWGKQVTGDDYRYIVTRNRVAGFVFLKGFI